MVHMQWIVIVEMVEIHWFVLNVNDNNVTYFGNFGVEGIPEEI